MSQPPAQNPYEQSPYEQNPYEPRSADAGQGHPGASGPTYPAQGYSAQPYPPQPGYPQQGGYPQGSYPQQGGGYAAAPAAVYPQLADGTPLSPWGPCADWSSRAIGLLWDILYNWPAFIALAAAFVALGVGSALAANAESAGTAGTAVLILGVLLYLLGFGLSLWRTIKNLYLDQGRTGQTWGKRKVGIRLVRESDGQPTGAGMCFLRYLLSGLINQIVILDYLWPLWDPKRQMLSDKILGNVVVKTDQQH